MLSYADTAQNLPFCSALARPCFEHAQQHVENTVQSQPPTTPRMPSDASQSLSHKPCYDADKANRKQLLVAKATFA